MVLTLQIHNTKQFHIFKIAISILTEEVIIFNIFIGLSHLSFFEVVIIIRQVIIISGLLVFGSTILDLIFEFNVGLEKIEAIVVIPEWKLEGTAVLFFNFCDEMLSAYMRINFC